MVQQESTRGDGSQGSQGSQPSAGRGQKRRESPQAHEEALPTKRVPPKHAQIVSDPEASTAAAHDDIGLVASVECGTAATGTAATGTAATGTAATHDETAMVASDQDLIPPLDLEHMRLPRSDRFVSSDPNKRRRWYTGALFGRGTDGRFIEYHFPQLIEAIKQFVREIVPRRKLSWDEFGPLTQARINAVTPEGRNYVTRSFGDLYLLVEAWIWRILWDHLLSPECVDKWKGAGWAGFGTHLREFRANVSRADSEPTIVFHLTRSNLARILYMIHGYHSDKDRLRLILRDHLDPLIRMSHEPRDHVAEKILHDISIAALRFDLATLASKFDIRVGLRDQKTDKFWGFQLQNDRPAHFTIGPFREMVVDLVFRPWVTVYGILNPDAPGAWQEEVIHRFDHCAFREPLHCRKGFFAKCYMDELLRAENKEAATPETARGLGGADESCSKQDFSTGTLTKIANDGVDSNAEEDEIDGQDEEDEMEEDDKGEDEGEDEMDEDEDGGKNKDVDNEMEDDDDEKKDAEDEMEEDEHRSEENDKDNASDDDGEDAGEDDGPQTSSIGKGAFP